MIYVPEDYAAAMSNRTSPELNREVAQLIAEWLATQPLDFKATKEDVEKVVKRVEEDA